MFTGIVEEVGQIVGIKAVGENRRLTVKCSKVLSDLKLGDSISVSGVCLTVVAKAAESFSADLARETWNRTSFSRLKPGASLNLELPMRAMGRFDGHIVQGHVDGIGTLVSMTKIHGGNDFVLTVRAPSEMTRYIVAKGSIAVEGISLTVASIEGTEIVIAIIPHTAEMTNLKSLEAGDPVNLEVDVVAKYVEKMMGGHRNESSITVEKLAQAGF